MSRTTNTPTDAPTPAPTPDVAAVRRRMELALLAADIELARDRHADPRLKESAVAAAMVPAVRYCLAEDVRPEDFADAEQAGEFRAAYLAALIAHRGPSAFEEFTPAERIARRVLLLVRLS